MCDAAVTSTALPCHVVVQDLPGPQAQATTVQLLPQGTQVGLDLSSCYYWLVKLSLSCWASRWHRMPSAEALHCAWKMQQTW